jgi:hypothetical protein
VGLSALRLQAQPGPDELAANKARPGEVASS